LVQIIEAAVGTERGRGARLRWFDGARSLVLREGASGVGSGADALLPPGSDPVAVLAAPAVEAGEALHGRALHLP
jgi:hypothetical protein